MSAYDITKIQTKSRSDFTRTDTSNFYTRQVIKIKDDGDDSYFISTYTTKDNKGGVETFSVDKDSKITEIDNYEFDVISHAHYCSIEKIDDTHFIVAYEDQSSSSPWHSRARVKTFSINNDYEISEEETFEHDSGLGIGSYTAIKKINGSNFVILYGGYQAGTRIRTISVDTSDYSVSSLSSITINSGATAPMINHCSIEIIDSTHFIIAYGESENACGRISTFSTDSDNKNISLIDTLTHHSTSVVSHQDLIKMDDTHYLLAFQNHGSDARLVLKVFEIDSDSDNIEEKSSSDFTSAQGRWSSIQKINEGNYIIAYAGDTNIRHRVRTFNINASYAFSTYDTYALTWDSHYAFSISQIDEFRYVLGYSLGNTAYLETYELEKPVSLPTVTTQAVDEIQKTQADGNGNITDDGGEDCTERGFVYSKTSRSDPGNVSPAVSDYEDVENETDSYSTGAFSLTMTGLDPGTTYYVRAYAKNSEGYAYGGEVSFETLDTRRRASFINFF